MIAKWTTLGLTVFLLAANNSYACSKQAKKMTVSGILKYFPDDVQSREAWYGHNFMVDDMPIQPFIIHKEELLKYIGKRVKITGSWNKGTEFHNDNQQVMPMPTEQITNESIIRNDGINAEKLETLNK